MSWPLVSLSELIVDEIGGISLGRDDFFDQGLPVIPKKAISADIDICEKSFAYTSHEIFSSYEKSFIDNSFVITVLRDLVPSGPNLGRICLLKESREYLLAQGVYGFKLAPECDPRYLAYISNSPSFREQVLRVKVGSTQVHVRGSEYKKVSIPLPPLSEQKRIAAILDKADAIRRKRQQAIKLADDFLRSVFLEMFGDPVTNPKGWEVTQLSNLVSKLGDGLHGTPDYDCEGEYHFINGNNLEDGTIVVGESTKRVSHEEYEKHKKDLNENTMLVSINGTIGKVAFYKGEKIVLGKSACYFNLSPNAINKSFLYHLIKSDYFLNYASGIVTGSTIKNVSLKSMREFPVPLPPAELQSSFSSIASKVGAVKENIILSLAKIDVGLSSLSQKAFSGSI